MSRYENGRETNKDWSLLKIIGGVTAGILLAGAISTAAWLWFAGTLFKTATEAIYQPTQQTRNQLVNLQSFTPINRANIVNNPINRSNIVNNPTSRANIVSNPHAIINSTIEPPIKLITKEEMIREKSEIALIEARNEAKSFDAQYKKPAECYNMKTATIRMYCTNAYMSAREAFEKAERENNH